MTMLRSAKLAALRAASGMGITGLVLGGRWRRQRLLILCYHGISIEDEHEWGPALFLPPALFQERMEALRDMRCAVLPLGEALDRLDSGELPSRAVAITFDDGGYDFYRVAYPILRPTGFPVTVYVSTYYAEYNRPVFDVMLSYLLWKARGRSLAWPEYLPAPVSLDAAGREAVRANLAGRARSEDLGGRDKDSLLAALAARLGIDYEALCARRILHLMTPAELKEMAAAGVDLQLHTHRHRVSRRPELFLKEIEDNRRSLAAVSSAPAVHFCYPGGFHLPEFEPVLEAAGVRSATTCEPGLAHRGGNRFALPRLLDVSSLCAVEFAAWVSGLAAWLPHRRLGKPSPTQLLEYTEPGA